LSRLPINPKLPPIAVEDESVKRSLSLPSELDRDLALYAEYFQVQAKRKPRSSEDVMVGIITAYLAGDALFQRWKKDRGGEPLERAAQERPARGKAAATGHHINGAAAST